jgi:hypothetical protein
MSKAKSGSGLPARAQDQMTVSHLKDTLAAGSQRAAVEKQFTVAPIASALGLERPGSALPRDQGQGPAPTGTASSTPQDSAARRKE